ncbi:MAG: SDR family oxidoreductase [Leucobacter sp.]
MRIAVAGGTGVVGAHVVRIALKAGHEVRVLSRSQGVDLVTGEGLDLTGVEAVIDVSGPSSRGDALGYFEASTHNLQRAEAAANVAHHIALSIVGAVEHPHGYYEAKALQEQLVADGPIPWTILRTTQFFEFAEQQAVALWKWALVVKMVSRPVAAESVARRLVEIAEGSPLGMTPELAGPDELRMATLARMAFETHGDQRGVIELPLPGKFGQTLRNGGALPGPNAEIDTTSFEDWLAAGAH